MYFVSARRMVEDSSDLDIEAASRRLAMVENEKRIADDFRRKAPARGKGKAARASSGKKGKSALARNSGKGGKAAKAGARASGKRKGDSAKAGGKARVATGTGGNKEQSSRKGKPGSRPGSRPSVG
jgi:hypothetical protein